MPSAHESARAITLLENVTSRRGFLTTITAGLLTAPPHAMAQKPTRIGWLSETSLRNDQANLDVLRVELHELGYVDGQNITIEGRWADGSVDRLPQLAQELVQLPVRMLCTVGSPAARAAKQSRRDHGLRSPPTPAGRARVACPRSWDRRTSARRPRPARGNRRAAYFVDRILKGASPGNLPVERPAKFDRVVNLKTAKALSLTISPSVLLRATEVIQ